MLDLILGAHLATYHHDTTYTVRDERPRIECVDPRTVRHPERGYIKCRAVQPRHHLSGINPGLYVLHRGTGLGGGVVRNSFERLSVHASWTWSAHRYIDVSVGAITREGIRDRTYPFVAPSLLVPLPWGNTARVSLLPGKGNWAMTLGIERRISNQP